MSHQRAIQLGAIMILVCFQLSEASVEVAKVDGDIYVAGLFEVQANDGGQCGAIDVDSVLTLEATRWYLEQLNINNAFPFKIGFRGYKTCGLKHFAVDRILDVIGCSTDTNSTGEAESYAGVIGPGTSEEAINVASVFSSRAEENRLIQISYSATATTLGDKTLYPTFYRVIPDDYHQIRTMVLLMKTLQWNRMTILYENNTYGRDGAHDLQEEARKELICVSQMLAITVSDNGDVSLDQMNAVLDEIMLQNPVTEGAVLFASKQVAQNILVAVNNKGVANVPLILLSESVGLQDDIFRLHGSILEKTKGTLSVSPPFTEITSFTDYWLSLFVNMTLFSEKAKMNPWLKDVFAVVTGCTQEPSSCPALTVEQARLKFPTQPVYDKYAILAAHAMSSALNRLYTDLCESDCLAEFRNKFKPNMMIDQMKGLSIDFGSDFPGVTVEPFTSTRYKVTFGTESNPISSSDHDVYDVYNFKRSSDSMDPSDFSLTKIGYLLDNMTLSLDIDALRDYDSSGAEMTFPNVRRGKCPVGQRCSECMMSHIPELVLHVPGDLYVIGVAPINNNALSGPAGCGSVRIRDGYQVTLAMKYAIEAFSNGTDYVGYRSKFGNKKIGLIVLNSCDNQAIIARKVLNLQHSGVTLETGKHIELTNRIIGYVGGLSSWVSSSVSEQLTRLGVVQVSYASTYPGLGNKSKFPYFLRIVPPDTLQSEAVMDVVEAIKGEYVQILYSTCVCGSIAVDSLTAAGRARGICIAQSIEVAESDRYYEYYEMLRRKPHAKIVILYLSSQIVPNFIRDLDKQMAKGEFHFIGSNEWGKHMDLLQYPIAKGSLTVTLEIEPIRGMSSYIQNQVPRKEVPDPWLEQYIQARQNCYFSWSHDKTLPEQCTEDMLPTAEKGQFQTDCWCTFSATSMFVLLMGSAEYYSRVCGNTEKLCQDYVDNPSALMEEIQQLTMDLYGTGESKIFSNGGDGNMGYQIYNIKPSDTNMNMLTYAKVGKYNPDTGLDINIGNIVYPTEEATISTCPNDQACESCFEPEPEQKEVRPESSSSTVVVLGVIVGLLGLAVIALVVFTLYMKRRKPKDDTYLTAATELERPEATGQADNPYHCEMIPCEMIPQEPKY